jgi:hypothetical protein
MPARHMVLFRDDWSLQHTVEKHPELKFLSATPPIGAAVAGPPANPQRSP